MRLAQGEAHLFDPSLLRENDIRGIFGQTLGPDDAYALGRAFGSVARRRGAASVAVGYDGRHSSIELASALRKGLAACGLQVAEIGMGPTPMLYYACSELGQDGGVMVTGSHNPPDYNGFKLVLQGESFFGDDIRRLAAVAAAADFENGKGTIRNLRAMGSYIERVLRDVPTAPGLKVAWDAGNGAMGEVIAAVAARLPGEHILINEQVDGDFPNHHPDPTLPENLKQLQDCVLRQGCDLGVAFDGDGDRLGLVDSEARIVWGDQILLLLAGDVLKRYPGAAIIGDVKCSQVFFDGVAALGGEAVMWKTGHSLVKSRMKKLGAPLAGEMSGHLFIADDYYGYDDGLYAALRVLSVLQGSGESLAGFRKSLPKPYNTPEIRVTCPEEDKFAIVDDVKARLVDRGADMIDIDGVRVKQGGGWWLLRASNTQSVLVLRCEATSLEQLQMLLDGIRNELAVSGLNLPDLSLESVEQSV